MNSQCFQINEQRFVINIPKHVKLQPIQRPVTHHVRYTCEKLNKERLFTTCQNKRLKPLDHLKYLQKLKKISLKNNQ
jgi:hypothetical protein